MSEELAEHSHGRPSPILIVFLLFPLLGIVAAVVLALSESSAPPAPATPLPVTAAAPSLIDQPAPNFALNGLDGTEFRLSSYRGRIVFLNFWATWCEPCVRELPVFQQFSVAQAEARQAVILAVNVGEQPDRISPYLDERGIDALSVLLDDDLELYGAYGIEVMPTTYVIDAAGVIRFKHLGEMTAEDLAAYLAEVSSQS
ncbi:MAG: TlpA family protein disulfide reductase [Anaerolineae bacterium]|nr:TlpA family protein disulfide reductase [Anaerolineae bacterium]